MNSSRTKRQVKFASLVHAIPLRFFRLTVGKFNEVIASIVILIRTPKTTIVLPCSLNDLASISKDKKIAAAYKQVDVATSDGMPLVFWARIKTRQDCERVYGPDLMRAVLQKSQGKEFNHGFVGTTEATIQQLIKSIRLFAPKIHITLSAPLPFRPLTLKEEEKLIREIKKTETNILWVGLSSPKQVLFAAKLKPKLHGVHIFCVGAAFDFLAGNTTQAPSWMQKLSLEWLYRLISNPKRLWKRYLIDIPGFLLGLFFQTFIARMMTNLKKVVAKLFLFSLSIFFVLLMGEIYLHLSGYTLREHSWIFSNEEFIQQGDYRNFFTLDRSEIFKPRPSTSIIPDYWETNEQGFRLNPQQDTQNEKGDYRVLVIGDSFAYGHGVRHEEAWPAVLEKKLIFSGKRVKIDNAGVPATGTDQQVIRLEKMLKKHHYDMVIWMVTFNDMVDSNNSCLFGTANETHRRFPAFFNVAYINAFLTKYLPRSFSTKTLIGNYLTTINYKGMDLFTLGCSKIVSDEELMTPYFEKLTYLTHKVRNELDSQQTQLFVILGPAQTYFDPAFENDSFYVQFLGHFIQSFKMADVQYIDSNAELAKNYSPVLSDYRGVLDSGSSFAGANIKDHEQLNFRFFLDEGESNPYGGRHLNALGNEAIANIIFSQIEW